MLESILDRFSKTNAQPAVALLERAASAAPAAPPAASPVVSAKGLEDWVAIVDPSAVDADAPPVCQRCGGHHHWQPRGQQRWFCIACEPPPSKRMVGAETGECKVRYRCAYSLGRPTCPRCGCRMVVESIWSDGLATFQCASCECDIPARLVA